MKAVFLDKDGTLLVNVPRNVDPALIRLAPRAPEAIERLSDAGFLLIVASNQPGFAAPDMAGVERRIRELGICLDGFYCCFHERNEGCACRKPGAGLLLTAARDIGIDLAHSWMVGDILDDVEAGHRAGCRAALIDNGNETQWNLTPERVPDVVAGDLAQAAEIICGRT